MKPFGSFLYMHIQSTLHSRCNIVFSSFIKSANSLCSDIILDILDLYIDNIYVLLGV